MIPSDIDCLIPVERRVLVILNRFGSSKPIKSFKIDGCVTGELHPHGSAYGTLVGLVRGGFASRSDSSWGGYGLNDSPPPASRYSETRIEPWVSRFAFEFVNHVPWEMLELDSEPLYLPSILPLGLIGDGVISGISFHRTLIPKYRKEDLALRLKFLLEECGGSLPSKPKSFEGNLNPKKYGPPIQPNKSNCEVVEREPNAFYRLLLLGEGAVGYNPKTSVREESVFRNNKKQKVEYLSVEGRAPNATFDPLLKAYEKGLIPIANAPVDQSKDLDIRIYLEPKRSVSSEELLEKIADKYLNKTLHFRCYTCNLQGVVRQTSVDQLLLNAYNHWKEAYRRKLFGDVQKTNDSVVEYAVCTFIRGCLDANINRVEDILGRLKPSDREVEVFEVDSNSNQIQKVPYQLTDKDFENIYRETPIRRLVEYKKTLDSSYERIDALQKEINEIDINSMRRIDDIAKSK